MKTKILLSAIALLILCNRTAAQVSTRDSLALVDLYNSTGGPNWKNHTNWLTAKPVSAWYGITVSNNRVTGIAFSYNTMSGTLPSSIGNLDSLQSLTISVNYTNLTGTIPSTIGNLHRLTVLNLSGNGFIGSIPYSIGSLQNLQTLYLDDNSLTGTLPLSMSKLKKLETFDASYNGAGVGHISGNGISGIIPDSLGFCTSLISLNLGYNSLTGGLPSSFQQLTKLQKLNMFTNQLSGPLTNVFSTNSKLTDVNLSENEFSGDIPSFFSQFTHLSSLLLAANQFSGTIPTDLANASALVMLDLSSNQLTGSIPAQLNTLPALTSLNLSQNQLTGQLPLLLHNYAVAYPNLNVSYNKLTNIKNPQFAGNEQSGTFNMAGNRFTFDGLEYLNEKYFTVNDISQAPLKIKQQNSELSVDAGGTLGKNIYYWYQAGSPTPVVVKGSASYQPAVSGSYYVNVKNKAVLDLVLTSDTVAYIAPFAPVSNAPILSFYPNPVKDLLTVTSLNDKATETISVTDMSGNVWVKTISRQQVSIRVDVSWLRAGHYLVSVDDGKMVRSLQFVKE